MLRKLKKINHLIKKKYNYQLLENGFSNSDIAIGKNVLKLDGAIVPKEEAPGKFPVSATHNMNCDDSYVNHSTDANLAYIGGTSFISAKNIKAGDELTMDYSQFAGDRKFLF